MKLQIFCVLACCLAFTPGWASGEEGLEALSLFGEAFAVIMCYTLSGCDDTCGDIHAMDNDVVPSLEEGQDLSAYMSELQDHVQGRCEFLQKTMCNERWCCSECEGALSNFTDSATELMNIQVERNLRVLVEAGLVFNGTDASGSAPSVDSFFCYVPEDPCDVEDAPTCDDGDGVESAAMACFAEHNCSSCEIPAFPRYDSLDINATDGVEILSILEGYIEGYCDEFKATECEVKACCPPCAKQIDDAFDCLAEPFNQKMTEDHLEGLVELGAVANISNHICTMADNQCGAPCAAERNASWACNLANDCEARCMDAPFIFNTPPEPGSIFSYETPEEYFSDVLNFTGGNCHAWEHNMCTIRDCCSECYEAVRARYECHWEQTNELYKENLGLFVSMGLVSEEGDDENEEALYAMEDFLCDIFTHQCFEMGEAVSKAAIEREEKKSAAIVSSLYAVFGFGAILAFLGM